MFYLLELDIYAALSIYALMTIIFPQNTLKTSQYFTSFCTLYSDSYSIQKCTSFHRISTLINNGTLKIVLLNSHWVFLTVLILFCAINSYFTQKMYYKLCTSFEVCQVLLCDSENEHKWSIFTNDPCPVETNKYLVITKCFVLLICIIQVITLNLVYETFYILLKLFSVFSNINRKVHADIIHYRFRVGLCFLNSVNLLHLGWSYVISWYIGILGRCNSIQPIA